MRSEAAAAHLGQGHVQVEEESCGGGDLQHHHHDHHHGEPQLGRRLSAAARRHHHVGSGLAADRAEVVLVGLSGHGIPGLE